MIRGACVKATVADQVARVFLGLNHIQMSSNLGQLLTSQTSGIKAPNK
jgi:chemotaxis receptor (MCP) glutamine deamidase CheD